MEKIFLILFSILLIFFQVLINRFSLKKNFFLNYLGSEHQKFTKSTSVPLTGGFSILLISLFVFSNYNILFLFLLFFLFLVGLMGDTNKDFSAKLRFFFQIFIITLVVAILDLRIGNLRIEFFDDYLNIYIFNIIFSILCMLILLNGTNFIDGCNTLVLGYYLLVLFFLKQLSLLDVGLNLQYYKLLFITLVILICFNFFGKLFLGDNGSYILAVVIGVLIIKIYQNNNFISPYFFANLLWYPCFEVLFSIFRKLNFKFSILRPDTKHFHQLLFFYLSKKLLFLKDRNNLVNSMTAILINIYNFFVFYNISQNIYNTKLQIVFLLINICLYVFIYLRLFNYKKYKGIKN